MEKSQNIMKLVVDPELFSVNVNAYSRRTYFLYIKDKNYRYKQVRNFPLFYFYYYFCHENNHNEQRK